MKNLLAQRIFKVVIPAIAVLAILAALYLYSQVRLLKQNPQAVALQETNAVIAKVARLIVLPVGETPTIATVSDPSALKDQTFFDSAQKGDKVLIYAQAKKAILYSVTLNKILNVAPLNIGETKAVTPPKADTTKTPDTNTKTP